jgi:hypothetical protein
VVAAAPPPEPEPAARPSAARSRSHTREASAERRGRGGRSRGKRKADEAAGDLLSPFGSSAVPAAPPPLPQVTAVVDAAHLARVCAHVEDALVARAGLPASYARGVTAPLQQRVLPGARVYPSAMYSFVIRQHAAQRDRATVAAALAAAQAEGSLR